MIAYLMVTNKKAKFHSQIWVKFGSWVCLHLLHFKSPYNYLFLNSKLAIINIYICIYRLSSVRKTRKNFHVVKFFVFIILLLVELRKQKSY